MLLVGHVHISHNISKLGAAIPSVNLPAGITCDPTAGCFKKCYARRGRFSFKNVRSSIERNLEIWHQDPEGFRRDVEIAATLARYFRLHSSGDIPDPAYLDMIAQVSEDCPGTEFLCFTKKFSLVNDYIFKNGLFVKNLHMVLSAWGDAFLPENPYNLPIAYIRLKSGKSTIPKNARPCLGYCGECVQTGRSCWDLKPGESVVFDER